MPGKRIVFDDDTLYKLTELGRRRMATLQELADEAFADLLRKHKVPIDLRAALRKSAREASAGSRPPRRNRAGKRRTQPARSG
jgi:hypothetical protein